MYEKPKDRSDYPQILPVFPLPNTVLFPLTVLPLHIFEPRYRTMVRDIVDGHGLIVIARGVGEGFDSLGTVGRVRELVPLDDGCYNLVLEGVERVSMVEAECDTPYRQVLIEPRPERPGSEDASVLEQSKLELLGSLGILLNTVNSQVPVVLNREIPLEVLINKACSGLPVGASARQRLLAENDLLGRQRRVSDYLAQLVESISQTGDADPDDETLLN